MPVVDVPEPIAHLLDALPRRITKLPARVLRILQRSDELLAQARADADELAAAVRLDVGEQLRRLATLQGLLRQAEAALANCRASGRDAEARALLEELTTLRTELLRLADFLLRDDADALQLLRDIRGGRSREDTLADGLRLADLLGRHRKAARALLSASAFEELERTLARIPALVRQLDGLRDASRREARELRDLRNGLLTLLLDTAETLRLAGQFALRDRRPLPRPYRASLAVRARGPRRTQRPQDGDTTTQRADA